MLDHFQVAAESINLVLVLCEAFQQRIDLAKGTGSCPDHSELLFQGGLELSLLLHTLNNLAEVDGIGRSAWNACSHCNVQIGISTIQIQNYSISGPCKSFLELVSQKCPSAFVSQ